MYKYDYALAVRLAEIQWGYISADPPSWQGHTWRFSWHLPLILQFPN